MIDKHTRTQTNSRETVSPTQTKRQTNRKTNKTSRKSVSQIQTHTHTNRESTSWKLPEVQGSSLLVQVFDSTDRERRDPPLAVLITIEASKYRSRG